MKASDNPISGDNQQETAQPVFELDARWIVGFVDGEGCFSVTVHRNPFVRRTRGWQLQAAFQIYQHRQHQNVLDAIAQYFGVGAIRPKGPRSDVLTYTVWSLRDLGDIIVPFFEANQLVVKRDDFGRFAEVIRLMRAKLHLTDAGFERAVRLYFAMNAQGEAALENAC